MHGGIVIFTNSQILDGLIHFQERAIGRLKSRIGGWLWKRRVAGEPEQCDCWSSPTTPTFEQTYNPTSKANQQTQAPSWRLLVSVLKA